MLVRRTGSGRHLGFIHGGGRGLLTSSSSARITSSGRDVRPPSTDEAPAGTEKGKTLSKGGPPPPSILPKTELKRPAIDWAALRNIFIQLGMIDGAGAESEVSSRRSAKQRRTLEGIKKRWKKPSLLAPLFTNEFVFEQRQLTAYGDILVKKYVADAVFDYCSHHSIIASGNVTRELIACVHNHYTLRYHAERLGFIDLSSPTHLKQGKISDLSFLMPVTRGPDTKDLRGTSFDYSPLVCGQSDLGWKFSHFIGCIGNQLGEEDAIDALDHLFGLNGASNLGKAVTDSLSAVLDLFPAASVAQSVLAGQGLVPRFETRTVSLTVNTDGFPTVQDEEGEGYQNEDRAEAVETMHPSSSGSHADESAGADLLVRVRDASSSSSLVSGQLRPAEQVEVKGFNPFDLVHSEENHKLVDKKLSKEELELKRISKVNKKDVIEHRESIVGPSDSSNVELQPHVNDGEALDSLAAGPGMADTIERWKEVNRERGIMMSSPSELQNPGTDVPSGFLVDDGGPEGDRRGAAFSGKIDFGTQSGKFFADECGIAQPEQGKTVVRMHFNKKIHDDPAAFGKNASKNGIPIETGGLTMSEYLKFIESPQERKFEVKMFVDPLGKMVGKVVADKFSVGRDAALRNYLQAVVVDILKLTSSKGE